MKIILVALVAIISSTSYGACVDKDSKAAAKSAMGGLINTLTKGSKSWTEVKKGTNIVETKNTIKMSIDFRDPFKTNFKAGRRTAPILKICESGGAVTITTGQGAATLRRSGDRISIKTFIGTYEVLPSNKVDGDRADIPMPTGPYYQESTVVI